MVEDKSHRQNDGHKSSRQPDPEFVYLENVNETCFALAVIQVIYRCFKKDIVTNSQNDDTVDLFRRMVLGKWSNAMELLRMLPNFNDGLQHDVHEFFGALLQVLPDHLKMKMALKRKSLCIVCFNESKTPKTSPIYNVEVGQHIPENRELEEYLASLTVTLRCDKCSQDQKTETTYSIPETTSLLVVNLIIDEKNAEGTFRPIKRDLVVPVELEVYGDIWRTIAMIERTEVTSDKRHYVAYVKNDQGWLKIDDHEANQAEIISMDTICTIVLERPQAVTPQTQNSSGQQNQRHAEKGGRPLLDEWKTTVEEKLQKVYEGDIGERNTNVRKVFEDSIGNLPKNLSKKPKAAIPTILKIQWEIETRLNVECSALDVRQLDWLKEKIGVCNPKEPCACAYHNVDKAMQIYKKIIYAEGAKADFARIRGRDIAIEFTRNHEYDGEPFTEMERKTFINDCISLLFTNGIVEWEFCTAIIPNLTRFYVSRKLDEFWDRYRQQTSKQTSEGTKKREEEVFWTNIEFAMGFSSFFTQTQFTSLKDGFYAKLCKDDYSFFRRNRKNMDSGSFGKQAEPIDEYSMQYKVPVNPDIVQLVIPWIEGQPQPDGDISIEKHIELYLKAKDYVHSDSQKNLENFRSILDDVENESIDIKIEDRCYKISKIFLEDLHRDVFSAINCLIYSWDIEEERAQLLCRATRIVVHIRKKLAHSIAMKSELLHPYTYKMANTQSQQSHTDENEEIYDIDEEFEDEYGPYEMPNCQAQESHKDKHKERYDIDCGCKDKDCPYPRHADVKDNYVERNGGSPTGREKIENVWTELHQAIKSCSSADNIKIVKELKDRMRWFADWPRDDCEVTPLENYTVILSDTLGAIWEVTTLVLIAVLHAFYFNDMKELQHNTINEIKEAGRSLGYLNFIFTHARRLIHSTFIDEHNLIDIFPLEVGVNRQRTMTNTLEVDRERDMTNTTMPLLTIKPNLFGHKFISMEMNKKESERTIYLRNFSKEIWQHEEHLRDHQFDSTYLNMFDDEHYDAKIFLVDCPCVLRQLINALNDLKPYDSIGFDCEFGHSIEKVSQVIPGCEAPKLDGKCASLLQIAMLEKRSTETKKPVISVYLVMFLKLIEKRTEFGLINELYEKLWGSTASKIGFASHGDLLAVRNALHQTRKGGKRSAIPINFKKVFCLEMIANKLIQDNKNPFTKHLPTTNNPDIVSEQNAAGNGIAESQKEGKRLADLCHSILGKPLSKDKDNMNFDDMNLTPKQIKYAAEDAFYTLKAFLHLPEKMGFTTRGDKQTFKQNYVFTSKVSLCNDDDTPILPPPTKGESNPQMTGKLQRTMSLERQDESSRRPKLLFSC